VMKSDWTPVRLYEPVRKLIHGWPIEVRKELGALLTRLQKGESVGMPDVRPMPDIAPGAAEIRVADRSGIFRTFHVVHSRFGILVFHAFVKKAQKTPERDKKTARVRLRAFLAEIEEDL
jgi:phage-related protein